MKFKYRTIPKSTDYGASREEKELDADDVLAEAIRILRKKSRWTKGAFVERKDNKGLSYTDWRSVPDVSEDDVSYCVIGALGRAMVKLGEDDPNGALKINTDIPWALQSHILTSVKEVRGLSSAPTAVTRWNDQKKTTHDEVLKVLRLTRKKLKAMSKT